MKDELDCLLTMSNAYAQSYTYNPIGNSAHKHAATALSTDANGNMITRVKGV